jgi:hypothetical protein
VSNESKLRAKDTDVIQLAEQAELAARGCVSHFAFIVFQIEISLLKRAEV